MPDFPNRPPGRVGPDFPAGEQGAPRPAPASFFSGIGTVTLLLIIASIAVAVLSGLGNNQQALLPFFISTVGSVPPILPEVQAGEVWRLFTPIFIHFGILHILFNLMWLKDLGSAIERRHGPMFFLALVATVALISNLAQYFIAGPFFGGMSGVVYGLFSYIWLRGKTDPFSGFAMPQQTIFLMMIWFVFCLTGKVGPVANAAHGAGLIVGAIWGVASGKLSPTVVIRGQFPGLGPR